MSARREELRVSGEVDLSVFLASGTVRVDEGAAGLVTVTVEGRNPEEFTIEQVGDRVVVRQPPGQRRWGSYAVTIAAPSGVRVDARLASADLEATAALGALQVDVASGALRTRAVGGDVRIAAASGDVRLGEVRGALQVTTASGDVRADAAGGTVEVKTASGTVAVGRAAGPVLARSTSGGIAIGRYDGPDLEAKTVSGDVRIGFPKGLVLDIDLSTLSGRVHNRFGLDDPDDSPRRDGSARVQVRTVSGDITIGPAGG